MSGHGKSAQELCLPEQEAEYSHDLKYLDIGNTYDLIMKICHPLVLVPTRRSLKRLIEHT